MAKKRNLGLVTSQNITAPKRMPCHLAYLQGLVTSQNITAPKLNEYGREQLESLVTSQNITAPKRVRLWESK